MMDTMTMKLKLKMASARRMRSGAWLLVGLLVVAMVSPAVAERSVRTDRQCNLLARHLGFLEQIADRLEDRNPFFAAWVRHVSERPQRIYTDGCVALNEIQSLGTHNSYHIMPRPALFQLLVNFDPNLVVWQYTHSPLEEQFGSEGIRQIELDIFRDPAGGLYGVRIGAAIVGDDPVSPDPEMFAPGLKVLHVQELDFETTCVTFVQCLSNVKAWSDANPDHLPIAVLVEVKDDVIPDPLSLGFVEPIAFDPASLDGVDQEILSVFPTEQLIRPDDIRVAGLTLEESVLQAGWPTLGESRGRVIFLMDNRRDDYVIGHPNLEGRVMFTNGTAGTPDAAFVKLNNPEGSFAEIQDLVGQGYLVRTRADADTIQARTGDTTRRDAAIASGAQFVSTDYPTPDILFGTGYQVTIPGGEPSRCNPLNAPSGCREGSLEDLSDP